MICLWKHIRYGRPVWAADIKAVRGTGKSKHAFGSRVQFRLGPGRLAFEQGECLVTGIRGATIWFRLVNTDWSLHFGSWRLFRFVVYRLGYMGSKLVCRVGS